jgi:hypothetical protein
LASLRLGGTALIWWEIRSQKDLATKGKIVSSWYEFTSALKKQFYPLGYMQQAMMDWQNLRQGKGQSVQEYTQEFRKKSLDTWYTSLHPGNSSQVYRRIA